MSYPSLDSSANTLLCLLLAVYKMTSPVHVPSRRVSTAASIIGDGQLSEYFIRIIVTVDASTAFNDIENFEIVRLRDCTLDEEFEPTIIMEQ